MSDHNQIDRLTYLLGQVQLLSANACTAAQQVELHKAAAALTDRIVKLVEKEVSEQ